MDMGSDSPGKREIKKPKVILAEGKDTYHFLCHALKFYRPQQEDVEVFNFGGITQLCEYLKGFTIYTGFDMVDTIVIVRDAETNASATFDSIVSSIQLAEENNANLEISIPTKPFEFKASKKRRCAIMIFPGPENNEGTLEDLCMKTVQNDPILPCVDSYLQCVQEKGEKLPRLHKNRLHTFLSGRDSVVGKPIGQAFQAKLFNPDHSALEPFKRIIQQM